MARVLSPCGRWLLWSGMITVLWRGGFLPAASARPVPLADSSSFSAAPTMIEPFHPRFVSTPPVIDGVLDEQCWKESPHVSGFTTYIPDYNIVPREQTEVALAYDRENLYFAFRCFDDVSKIKASLSGRDKITQDDWVCINLDSFNDHQTLTAFYVNPLGIQGDSRFVANNEDFNPDFVWYSAGKIDSAGYTVEIRIPLKSLRYAGADPTEMGVILERFISRRAEHSTFPRMDPARGYSLLTEMYPIVYRDIEHPQLIEILPEVTALRQDSRTAGILRRSNQSGEFGLTAKYGLTSDLVLDGTVNPDFSQVETDAAQIDVNLRFSLFYPEKRPFFLEGQDNFTLGSTSNPTDPVMFYSRTIADPVVGTKLTGKIGDGNTVAAIYALDNVLESDRDSLGRYAHVPVIRYKRTLSNDSFLGLIYAGRELERTYNRVAGFDELYRVSDAGIVESSGFLSWARDLSAGSSVGNTLGARYSLDTRNFNAIFSVREVSPSFRADMGYVTRTGITTARGFISPKFYPQSAFVQRIDPDLTLSATEDRVSRLWETNDALGVNVFFLGNWRARSQLTYATEIFDGRRFNTSGGQLRIKAFLTKKTLLQMVLDHSKSIYYPAAEQGRSNTVNTTLTLQPWETLSADGSLVYSDFVRDNDGARLYGYSISRLKVTYQPNEYLSFRIIGEYDENRRQLSTNFLASLTSIPGTAVYLGYGSFLNKLRWEGGDYVPGDQLIEMRRELFLKLSYLWRS